MLDHNKQAISFDHPLYINGLRIFPNRFEYGVLNIHFSKIQHITLHLTPATKTSQQQTELRVISRDADEMIFKSRLKQDDDKLLRAHDYLCEKTYYHRMKNYLTELNNTQKFHYLDCDIYRNGDLVTANKRYHIEELDITTGCATLKQQTFLGDTGVLHLTRDKDVLVSLLDHLIKHPSSKSVMLSPTGEQISHEQPIVFHTIGLLCKYITADNKLTREHVQKIKPFLTQHFQLGKDELILALHQFNQAHSSPHDFVYHCKALLEPTSTRRNLRRHLLNLLFVLGQRSTKLTYSNEMLLIKAEAIFQLTSPLYQHYKSQQEMTKDCHSTRYVQALHLLGLSQNSSVIDIKRAYKKIVIRFHPDRMHHLGTEVVEKADNQMKKVNSAYEYLLAEYSVQQQR